MGGSQQHAQKPPRCVHSAVQVNQHRNHEAERCHRNPSAVITSQIPIKGANHKGPRNGGLDGLPWLEEFGAGLCAGNRVWFTEMGMSSAG